MTFPLINKIYLFNNEETIVWQQDLFRKVYLRTVPKNGESIYYTVNWWKFMRKAKYIKDISQLTETY